MSLANKKLSTTYGSILNVDNANTGVTSSLQTIKDGVGNTTAVRVSDRSCVVRPGTNSTSSFLVENAAGDDILVVDSTNADVKVNGVYVNTSVHKFGIMDMSVTSGYHYAMMSGNAMQYDLGDDMSVFGLANGTDPSTSVALSSDAKFKNLCYWYISSKIKIDQVHYMASTDSSATINFHLMSYAMATGSGSDAGDLTDGSVVASTGVITTGDDRISNGTFTISGTQTANAGRVILCVVEESDGSDDITASVSVKYHYVQ